MCGIAGCALSPHASPESSVEAARRMVHQMRVRGPDAEGLESRDGVVLGHRRLAILDLTTRANQPMVSDDERYSIVFNGEIYNFRELRRDLERDGVRFRTASDTEVLLALYARYGDDMLHRLRGMFAMAIWDAHSRELWLARDPYGIKPLYYTRTRDGLVFASQVKALLASGLLPGEFEPAGLAGFYLWGSVPEPWTLYRDAFALPAGHWMRVRNGVAGLPVCWHDIRQHWQGHGFKPPGDELMARVREALTDSVRAHLVSDVPIGVFLSGGVDSTVVAVLSGELGVGIEAITIGFDEFAGRPEDEVPTASATAARYGLPHVERRVSRIEFAHDTARILAAMDQPSVDGINTWFAGKAAAERGFKVVLSGIGGDELFCGYSSFARIPRAAALGRAAASNAATRALLGWPCTYLGKRLLHSKVAALPSLVGSLEGAYFLDRGLFMPEELPTLIGAEMAREGLARLGGAPAGVQRADARDQITAIGLLESTMYLRNQLLRDSDWASMAHSLELRTPMVDVNLLTTLGPFISEFAGGAGKVLLSQSPRQGLPRAVVTRPKTGFAVPMATWLHRPDFGSIRRSARRSWARQWATIVLGAFTAPDRFTFIGTLGEERRPARVLEHNP